MASAPSVFYSWQSNLPAKFNRNFIEEVLEDALFRINQGYALEPSPRQEVVLDKDVLGEPGSPAVTETIFRKIDECSVFVGDLSFVGQSIPGTFDTPEELRYFANPNVIIEHTHAMGKAEGVMS